MLFEIEHQRSVHQLPVLNKLLVSNSACCRLSYFQDNFDEVQLVDVYHLYILVFWGLVTKIVLMRFSAVLAGNL